MERITTSEQILIVTAEIKDADERWDSILFMAQQVMEPDSFIMRSDHRIAGESSFSWVRGGSHKTLDGEDFYNLVVKEEDFVLYRDVIYTREDFGTLHGVMLVTQV